MRAKAPSRYRTGEAWRMRPVLDWADGDEDQGGEQEPGENAGRFDHRFKVVRMQGCVTLHASGKSATLRWL